jgi:hypothetical protein
VCPALQQNEMRRGGSGGDSPGNQRVLLKGERGTEGIRPGSDPTSGGDGPHQGAGSSTRTWEDRRTSSGEIRGTWVRMSVIGTSYGFPAHPMGAVGGGGPAHENKQKLYLPAWGRGPFFALGPGQGDFRRHPPPGRTRHLGHSLGSRAFLLKEVASAGAIGCPTFVTQASGDPRGHGQGSDHRSD